MAGNANYDGLVAFVAEKSFKKDFQSVWTSANPLLTMIVANKANFNTSRVVEGHRMVLPITYSDGANVANGVLDANELTPLTPQVTQGFTQAQYNYSHYTNAFYIRDSEKKLISGSGVRGNIMGGKTAQLMDSFKLAVQNDMVSANADTRDAVLGLRYVTSTSNSPGNVSQTTYPVWAASVVSNAGPFYMGLLDTEYDRINALGRGVCDFALLSHTATNNVYGKVRDQIPYQLTVSATGKLAKFGFPTFEYLEMTCIQENKLGAALAGCAMVGRSSAWYANLDSDTPQLHHAKPLEGTDATEYLYNWWLAIGTDDPASLSLIQDIAA